MGRQKGWRRVEIEGLPRFRHFAAGICRMDSSALTEGRGRRSWTEVNRRLTVCGGDHVIRRLGTQRPVRQLGELTKRGE